MRSIKSITRKLFEQIENFISLLLLNLIHRLTALAELFPLNGHLVLVLFPHGAPQQIRTAKGIAREHLGRLHDLFLIHKNTVGIGGDFLQKRMRVLDLRLTLFALNIIVNQVHRAGPIQRQNRVDIFDIFHVKPAAGLHHPTGFQLEHRHSFASIKQVKRRLIRQRNTVQIELREFAVN